MAKPGRAQRGSALGRRAPKRPTTAKKPVASARKNAVADVPSVPEAPRVFRLGTVAGATPGRWIDAWKQRMPNVSLELTPLGAITQRSALDDLDAALIRLPLADESLHVIALYDEVPVVVASVDSHLMAADELEPADLIGEVLITPLDDVLGPLDIPGAAMPAFAPLATTADAIDTVASGVGIVVVPMSLARLHHRKDVDHRALRGGPLSTVALVWDRERTTADVDVFIGIVRGRTANSSR